MITRSRIPAIFLAINLGILLLVQLLSPKPISATTSERVLAEPSSIRVRMTRLEQPGGPVIIHTVNFQDYLKVVLPNEWTANWQNSDGTPESLRAGAVAVRTFGWYRVNNPLSSSPSYHLTDRSQDYDPNDPVSNHPNTNQAIADTAGVYLTYGGQVIRAEHRANTGNPTFDSEDDPVVGLPTLDYLRSVFEPVSNQSSLGAGLNTTGSRYWARGRDAGSKLYPPWNYWRILAHYYTRINFAGLNPYPT